MSALVDTERTKHEFEDLKERPTRQSAMSPDDRSPQAEGLLDRAGAEAGKVADDMRDALRNNDAPNGDHATDEASRR